MKRCLFLLLILLNLAIIFFFSHQDAKSSKALSNAVSRQVEIRTPDYEQKNQAEKNILHANMQSFIRKSAHTFLFCTLGIWLYLYGNTFGKSRLVSVLLTVGVGFFCALGDEFHQMFIPGRTAEWSDVGSDMVGIAFGIILTLLGTLCSCITKKTVTK